MRSEFRKLLFLIPLFMLFRYNPVGDVMIIITAALIHEAGHFLAIFAKKGNVGGFFVSETGAEIVTRGISTSYVQDMIISLAGAAANLLFAALSVILIRQKPTSEALLFLFANFMFGVFNLIPAGGLDGESFLYAVIAQKKGPDTAENVTKRVSAVLVPVLIILGIAVFIKSKGNFSLLLVSFSMLFSGKGKK